MSFNKDSTVGTLVIAVVLCVVCGLIVSFSAVSLRPQQEANMLLDRQKNILQVAGLYEPGINVKEAFASVEERYVDFNSGEYVQRDASYDQYAAAGINSQSIALTDAQDIAKVRRRANVGSVYLSKDSNGDIQSIILPLQGYGLWSTMYGYLSVANDGQTVQGIVFYRHGETPGMGGEISNPVWQAKWVDKQLFDDNGNVALKVIKGSVDDTQAGAEFKVDGLSGATLTSKGVDNLIHFWLGDMGYGPYLKRYSVNSATESQE